MNNLYLLADERIILTKLKGTASLLQEQLEQTPEYKALQEAENSVNLMFNEINRVEMEIRKSIIAQFLSSGLENTKPYDGIQIKKFSIVHILDERGAIKWAAVNAPQVLSLKKAPFNKIAKVLDLDFVEIDDEYRAQIASDLSIYEDKENG